MRKHFVIICFMVLVLAGCSRQTAAPVAMPVHDTLWRERLEVDTVYSDRWHYIDRKGDTVWLRDSVVVYRAKYIHDTARAVETVSVPVPMVKTEYVERPLSWWQQLLLGIGRVVLIVVVLWLIIKGYRVWQKR